MTAHNCLGKRTAATPAATTFALLLGFAVGRRGRLLFETPWTAVLDTSPDDLIDDEDLQ